MSYLHKDEDTGIIHIHISGGNSCLCGLTDQYTDQEDPVKEQFGSTCQGCIEELKELRNMKK